MNKLSYFSTLISGILMCVFFIPHAFLGTPEVQKYISNGLVATEAASTFMIIWMFSSITMLLIGIWLLFLANSIKIGSKSARFQVLIIGFALLLFWAEAYWYKPEINHLLLFAIVGILLILSFLTSKKSYAN